MKMKRIKRLARLAMMSGVWTFSTGCDGDVADSVLETILFGFRIADVWV